MLKEKKYPAGILQYTVVVVIVVSILSLAILGMLYLYTAASIRTGKRIRAIDNLNNGINYALVTCDSLPINKEIFIGGTDHHLSDSILIMKRYWGIFPLLFVKSKHDEGEINDVFIAGKFYKHHNQYALYLKDNNRVLSVSGNSRIRYNAYLPKAGIRKAFVNGSPFTGNSLVEGDVYLSLDTVPVLPSQIDFQEFTMGNELQNFDISFISGNRDNININSFYDTTICIKSTLPIELSSLDFRGNYIIQSDSIIIIDSSCMLEDVIVVAPEINVRSGFKGSIQMFASNMIRVEEDVELKYPSSMILFPDQNSYMTPEITINKNVDFSGVIINSTRKYLYGSNNITRIEEGSEIHGEIYSVGNLFLQSPVYGRVICENFRLKTSTSTLDNYLFNNVIDLDSLPDNFIGLGITDSLLPYKPIKWLD